VEVPFRLVDVFAERPLSGNQLCVVPEPVDLSAEEMQAVALEIGFSETTFVTDAAGDRYRMRIFTPHHELPFAGHPTLGTAFVLVSEGKVSSPAVQEVAAGEFRVEADIEGGKARVQQHAPIYGPEVGPPDRVAAAAGIEEGDLHPDLPPQVVSTGTATLIVPASSAEAVAAARPQLGMIDGLTTELQTDGLYLFAITDDGAKARFFAPGIAVDEDPGTGSAAGPLGAYLSARGAGGMPGRLLIRQGEEVRRPCLLEVEVEPEGESWRVLVGGGVFVVGSGAFQL
jgi:trans-2,3-dihydro-3-hydroxyanthranilate isomerase